MVYVASCITVATVWQGTAKMISNKLKQYDSTVGSRAVMMPATENATLKVIPEDILCD